MWWGWGLERRMWWRIWRQKFLDGKLVLLLIEHASALQQASNGCCSCCRYLNWLLFQCSLHTSWTLSFILDPSQSLLYNFGFHPSCVCGDDVTSWNMVTWRPHWDSSSDKSRIFPKIFWVLQLGLKWTESRVYPLGDLDLTHRPLCRSLNPLQVTFWLAIMNAEAVSQLVTVLEKTTSPDQVPDHDKEVVEVAQII